MTTYDQKNNISANTLHSKTCWWCTVVRLFKYYCIFWKVPLHLTDIIL